MCQAGRQAGRRASTARSLETLYRRHKVAYRSGDLCDNSPDSLGHFPDVSVLDWGVDTGTRGLVDNRKCFRRITDVASPSEQRIVGTGPSPLPLRR